MSSAQPLTTTTAAGGASRQLRKRSTRAQQQQPRTTLADNIGSSSATKNVVVLGGSYGGMHAATVLANRLPPSHRVILIERNSHFNHLYVFPRFSTLPGHEHKAFVPFTSIFKDAPKRPVRAQAEPVAGPSAAAPTSTSPTDQLPVASSSWRAPPSTTPTASTSEQTLGMGAVSGGKVPSRRTGGERTGSDTSSADGRSRYGSTDSRSSSLDGNSYLFENDRRNDRLQAAADFSTDPSTSSSSAASSYRSSTFVKPQADKLSEERASKLAGSGGLEKALPVEGAASRAEEALGRPEIKVEELSEAVSKGIRLDDGEEAAATAAENPSSDDATEANVETAQGFEQSSPHIVLQANVSSITPTHVVVEAVEQASSKQKLWSIDSVSIPYSHLIYALGSHLPDPLRTDARTKPQGMSWMQAMQARIRDSHEIVLVGGGALGVEFATDIKSVHPRKKVTLIHSRKQLLPNFDVQVHEHAYKRLKDLGVRVVLGERLALQEGCPRGSTVREDQDAMTVDSTGERCPPSANADAAQLGTEGAQARNEGMCLGNGRKRVKTTGGKEFECDLLLLCTGQQPNSGLMAQLSPTSVDASTRLVRVMRTLQVKVPDPHGSLAQMPFDARPPCGDCDCFLDKKAAGGDADESSSLSASTTQLGGHDSCLPNVYAIGDVADAFGALNAGYQAWSMADVAAENIVRDIQAGNSGSAASSTATTADLQHFEPAANMLKLSLGLGTMVFQGAPDEKTGVPVVEVRDDPDDLTVEGVWTFMAGVSTDDMYI